MESWRMESDTLSRFNEKNYYLMWKKNEIFILFKMWCLKNIRYHEGFIKEIQDANRDKKEK